jgi:replication-associated recombination protein RarA
MRLWEKHRPKTWAEVIGQAKVLAIIDRLRKGGGLAGRAYYLSGASGTGKTSIAYLIAGEVAAPWAIEEVDGTQVTAAWLNRVEDTWGSIPLGGDGKTGRAYCINEAHGLSGFAVKRLLSLLEDRNLPRHVVVLFTSTVDGLALFEDGQTDAHPLLSRCTQLALTSQGLCKLFAKRAKEIAESEGLDGQPVAKYERLAADEHNNMRAILSRIEEGVMAEAGT